MTAYLVDRRRERRLADIFKPEPEARLLGSRRLARLPLPNRERVLEIVRIFASDTPSSEVERKAFAQLKVATVGVALTTVGIFYFPLQIVGVACLLPTMAGVFADAFRHLIREWRVSGEVFSAVFLLGTLVGGFFLSLSVGGWFVVLVRWLAIRTEDHTKQGIINLFGQHMRSVWTIIDGTEVEVPIERMQAGDLIVVHAGQMVPMDGLIVEGYAVIDEHMLTGEAQPAEKGPGDRVMAATIAQAGRLSVLVEKTGAETTAAQIGQVLTDTNDFKASLISRADAFNDKISLPFLLLSAFFLPYIGLDRALGLMMGAPGYRMILYGPLSMLSFLHLAAREGILIKDGRSLETLLGVDTVVFDKTGTLTMEQPHITGVHTFAGYSQRDVLTFAAAAEAKQSHPIARAILAAAANQGINLQSIEDAAYEIGYGIQVKLNGKQIRVGSSRFIETHNIPILPAIHLLQEETHRAGESLVLVAVEDQVAGGIVLQPTLRPEVRAVVGLLQKRGLKLYIISGDHEEPTRRMADELGIDGYYAEVLPADKAGLVKKLQEAGRTVCFVGDGINDSIALKSANVSISLRGATTIAIDTAHLVLMDGDLSKLPRIFSLAEEFAENMRINFLAATLPCVVIVGGALFLGWGLLPCTILYQVSVPFALYNTVRPLLTQSQSSIQIASDSTISEDAAPKTIAAFSKRLPDLALGE